MRWVCALLLLCLLTGCGPTAKQVADQYQAPMDQLRTKLAALAGTLPQANGDQRVSSPLNPPLVLVADDPTTNTDVLAFEQLANPAAKLDFDLLLGKEVNTCLRWTSDLRPESTGDPKFMKRCFDQAVATRYLVVHRTLQYEPPQAFPGDRYSPAQARIAGLVVDLQTDAVVATYIVAAQSNDSVNFVVRSDESREQGMIRFARSTLWENIRKEIALKLAQMTGGTVQIDRTAPKHTAPPAGPSVATPPIVTANTPSTPLPAEAEPSPTPSKRAPAVPSVDSATQQYLRALKPTKAAVLTQDEHRLLRDFSVSGTTFKQGLYSHPPAANQPGHIVFKLDKQYKALAGGAGQTDGARPPVSFSPLTFRIVGDGRELWRSAAMHRHGDWSSFTVDVSGIDTLELFVDCPGTHDFAWGAWMDPVLTKAN